MLALVLILNAAPNFSQVVARGKELYFEAQFGEAIAQLDEALSRPDVSAADRREALLYIGFSQIGLGNEDAAKRRFTEVLKSKPDMALPPGTSPKIKAIFERVRVDVQRTPTVEPMAPLMLGQRIRFKVTQATAASHKAVLFWRGGLLTTYTRVPLDIRADGTATADLDTRLFGAGRATLEYYVEIREGDALKAQLGDYERPKTYVVGVTTGQPATVTTATASESTPVYKTWWFWTIIGVAVVGGAAVGTYFIVQSQQRPEPTTGNLQISFEAVP